MLHAIRISNADASYKVHVACMAFLNCGYEVYCPAHNMGRSVSRPAAQVASVEQSEASVMATMDIPDECSIVQS